MLSIVDDFKLSGPKEHLEEGWDLFRSSIKTDEPHPVDLFLGCKHVQFERTLPECGKKVRGIEYDMSEFMQQCVDVYVKLAGPRGAGLRQVDTPFLPDDGVVDTDEGVCWLPSRPAS